MLAIHPRMTIYTGKLTKRLSDRDKKEIARFASSRLTLDLPRYLWSLIWFCGRFLLVFCPFCQCFCSSSSQGVFGFDRIMSNLLYISLHGQCTMGKIICTYDVYVHILILWASRLSFKLRWMFKQRSKQWPEERLGWEIKWGDALLLCVAGCLWCLCVGFYRMSPPLHDFLVNIIKTTFPLQSMSKMNQQGLFGKWA